eukprot:TRINITY_DN20962_c0_g1_i2.p1 TRINITY_DN20962_c0_g1~~TRINITY_DN20962_c0_g1_i2.p1  ORF type:complete len:224 (+),score=33.22 TRINITY_DN20962_c0_g1_i2:101-772(+)
MVIIDCREGASAASRRSAAPADESAWGSLCPTSAGDDVPPTPCSPRGTRTGLRRSCARGPQLATAAVAEAASSTHGLGCQRRKKTDDVARTCKGFGQRDVTVVLGRGKPLCSEFLHRCQRHPPRRQQSASDNIAPLSVRAALRKHGLSFKMLTQHRAESVEVHEDSNEQLAARAPSPARAVAVAAAVDVEEDEMDDPTSPRRPIRGAGRRSNRQRALKELVFS